MDRVSEERMSEFVEALSLLVKDSNGLASTKELVSFAQSFNMDELVDMISKVNMGSGSSDFIELLNQNGFVTAKDQNGLQEEEEEEVKEVFKVFDKDQNGFITAKELRNVMISLGEKLTEDEAEQMIREADWDGDGLVNYEDFARMMAAI